MFLADMQNLFYENTASLASDLDLADVDKYLNRSYQYTVPLDLDGEFTEQMFDLQCINGQIEYTYPPQIIGLRLEAPWIDSRLEGGQIVEAAFKWLRADTVPASFRRKNGNGLSPGSPNRLLFYGKTITLDRPPDDTYRITIPVRGGPPLVLDSFGIAHDIHALAVVASASAEYLTTMKDTESVTEQANNYSRYRDQLRTYSQSRPDRRRPARSF